MSRHPFSEDVSGAGGRLPGEGSRSDWVIIRLPSSAPKSVTTYIARGPGLEVHGRRLVKEKFILYLVFLFDILFNIFCFLAVVWTKLLHFIN